MRWLIGGNIKSPKQAHKPHLLCFPLSLAPVEVQSEHNSLRAFEVLSELALLKT